MVLNCAAVCRLDRTASSTALFEIAGGTIAHTRATAAASAIGMGMISRHPSEWRTLRQAICGETANGNSLVR